jgi:hypothetical protein
LKSEIRIFSEQSRIAPPLFTVYFDGMITDIKRSLQAHPFEPFVIVTNSGDHYRVATPDHADINPAGTRVVIWFDDESNVTVAGLHIAAVEREATQAS